MKRIFVFATLFLCCFVGINAQEATILDVNKTSAVNLVVDFSKASIHNMTEEDFAKYEEDYYKDMPILVGKLVNDFNRSGSVNFVIGTFPDSPYTLKVEVVFVSTKGDIMSNSTIVDAEGNVIASVNDLYAKGGHVGTKLNLMGDGMYKTGKLLARSFGDMIYEQEKILRKTK